ncbi:carbohydrate diacid transcriptional activator CdaR [Mycobacterium basiliense]|uniref:Carbohydrate diacid transcriptional activator CdaR n=1 Tax=Mycobacterium basiliense TaxID=2094119 RepID=A0A3S4BDQ3_9MYCO|nr:PucR family transcriptional regulator [Mycobacterium basiliense]VDM88375.1 carbohydrate diacid transcriptional activator CdaR [Mycobacterium basiliense]
MVWREPSQRIRELIREASWIALNPKPEWLDELDRATLAPNSAIADDPALAAVVSRSNRANLLHFAAANLRDPGAPVPPLLGAEQLRMARDLVRCGMDSLALEVYRIGHNVALRRWTEIVFGLTSDPQELRELLDGPVRAANEFVDATLAALVAQMRAEHDELTHNVLAERRKVVESILDGSPINCQRVETQLEYHLDRSHTAAVIWSEVPDGDYAELDRVVDAFGHAAGGRRPLAVVPNAATRWVWVSDAKPFQANAFDDALASAPQAHIAIGTPARGIEGFRRSHLDALITQQMLARLRSSQRVAFFAEVEMVALLTQNLDNSDNFIKTTLGDFVSASPELHTTLLTFIKNQCNASRAAKALFIHRNTLLHRLEAAQRLLPGPLDETSLYVAVALETMQWRGNQTGESPQALN